MGELTRVVETALSPPKLLTLNGANIRFSETVRYAPDSSTFHDSEESSIAVRVCAFRLSNTRDAQYRVTITASSGTVATSSPASPTHVCPDSVRTRADARRRHIAARLLSADPSSMGSPIQSASSVTPARVARVATVRGRSRRRRRGWRPACWRRRTCPRWTGPQAAAGCSAESNAARSHPAQRWPTSRHHRGCATGA